MYERGKGLAFHFDKDEHLFNEEQRMVHPLLSSILYLTGAAFPKRLGRMRGCIATKNALHCPICSPAA